MAETIVGLTVLFGVVGVQLLIGLGLFVWARFVARRHRAPWWRHARWLPLVALALMLVGVGLSALLIVRAFSAVAGVDAAMKATLLAQGISEATNTGAFFSLPAWVLYVVSLVSSVVGSLGRPRPSSEGGGPHGNGAAPSA